MAVAESIPRVFDEIAAIIAQEPTREELLSFRPSDAVQARARDLLALRNQQTLTVEEQLELDQFTQAELLMRLIKARLQANGQS